MFKEIKFVNLIGLRKIISSLFFSLILVTLFFKINGSFILETFDKRIISEATIKGIDIGARTTFYYQATLLGIISFVFFYVILIYSDVILKRILNDVSKNYPFTFESNFFHSLSLFGILTIVFGLFGVGENINLLFILSLQFLIVLLIILKCLASKYSWNEISFIFSDKNFIIWLFIQSFIFMFYAIYFRGMLFAEVSVNLAIYYILSFIMNSFLVVGIVLFLNRKNLFNIRYATALIIISCIPLFISPIYIPLANEIYLVLNQKGIFLLPPRKIVFLFLIITIFVAVVISYFSRRKLSTLELNKIIDNYYYPIFLVILVSILFQPPKVMGPPNELFESGNPGIAVDQFFRYGKIPILETFNAHALSELYAPLIYSFINGYHGWVSLLYNELFDKVIYFLIGYFLLRKLLPSGLSFLLLIFFPLNTLMTLLLPEYYIVGIVAIFVMHKVMKNPSLMNYLIFFFVLFFTFLWRFDLGAAVIPSSIITLSLYFYLYSKKWYLKEAVLAGLMTGGLALVAFILLAEIKDIPVIFRIRELLAVVSSNQVWGLSTLGNNEELKYSLFYIIVPAITLLMIVYLIVKTKWFFEINPIIFSSISFLLFFTLFNFPRGLVRHSLAENMASFLLGFIAIPLFYSPYLSQLKSSQSIKFTRSLMIGVAYSFVILISMQGTKIQDNSLIAQSVNRFLNHSDYLAENAKIDRYIEREEYKSQIYGGLKQLFDQTMEPEDTFIDFANAPYLYIHTKRETPMYVNQTPAFLSDEITQNYYLEEIQAYSIPYVVFSDEKGFKGIDGVPNHIRSYRVAEYIYDNYVPFIDLNGFDVWVHKDEKLKMERKLEKLPKPTKELLLIEPNIETSEIDSFDINDLKATEDGIVLKTGETDPQLKNLLKVGGLDKLSIEDNNTYELSFEYSAEKGGDIQIYYLFNDTYKDEDSIKFNVKEVSYEIKEIPISNNGTLKDIRIDLPNNENFTIHSLKLKVTSNVYEKLRLESSELTDVGFVPYLWGEEDSSITKDTLTKHVDMVRNKHSIRKGSYKNYQVQNTFDKKEGNFVYLRLKSENIGGNYKVELAYGSKADSFPGGYTFDVKADGKYHDYLIRVSSQYMWYTSPIDYIRVSTQEDTVVKNISILKGD